MRNTLTVALLSAASLCAFACVTPAAAQSNANAPKRYPNGECQMLAGNRVCTATPAYGYGYGGGGPFGFGAAIAAPVNAAGALAAAPVAAAGAVAAAPFGVAPALRVRVRLWRWPISVWAYGDIRRVLSHYPLANRHGGL